MGELLYWESDCVTIVLSCVVNEGKKKMHSRLVLKERSIVTHVIVALIGQHQQQGGDSAMPNTCRDKRGGLNLETRCKQLHFFTLFAFSVLYICSL